MKLIRYLTRDDLVIIVEEYRHYFKALDDPLPDFALCNTDKIDSIIAIPQKTFGGKELYPTLYQKAACYFYFINKLHPFFNGNKRLSIFVTSIFFMMNNYELTYSDEKLYQFARRITISKDDQSDELEYIALDLAEHTKPVQDAWMYLRQTWVLVTNLFQNITLRGGMQLKK